MYKFITCLTLFICLFLAAGNLPAQVTLSIEKIDTTQYPLLRVHLVTQDGGVIRRDLQASAFSLTEDGFMQGPLSYNCPQGNNSFSLAILIATGGSMDQSKLDIAKSAADAIVTQMDGNADEATLMSYATIISTDVFLTSDKALLQNGVANLSLIPAGQNKLWDGVATAISEIQANGNNPVKAVLVCSNGVDDASSNSLASVVSIALTYGIKVYCVGAGVASGSQGAANLQGLATQTGGKYWSSPGSGWDATLINALRGTPDACILQYTSNNSCLDGYPRAIRVTATIGADSGSVNGSYRMKQDASTYQTALFAVDTATIGSGKTNPLAILLKTPLANRRFHPAQIVLSFDTAKIRVAGVNTAGTLSDGLSVSVTNLATGAQIDFSGVKVMNGNGVLVYLLVRAGVVPAAVNVPVTFSSLTFSQGCIIPQISSGSVLVLPKTRAMTHAVTAPGSLAWSVERKDYDPNPFTISVRVTNSGELPLTNVRGTLGLQPGLNFVSGSTGTASVVPSSLDTTQEGTVSWTISCDPLTQQKSFNLPLSFTCDEGTTSSSSVLIAVPQAGAKLLPSCSAPPITVQGNDYSPNPFPISLQVQNQGGSDGAPAAEIFLPAGLSLENDTALKQLSAIAPGGSGGRSWSVRAARTGVQKVYDVRIVLSGAGMRNDTCSLQVTVPGLNAAPDIATDCITLPRVYYDSATRTYDPNPINVSMKLYNRGTAASDSLVTAILTGRRMHVTPPFRKIPGLAAGDSTVMTWVVTIDSIVCWVSSETLRVEISSKGQPVESCIRFLDLPARLPNSEPDIVSFSPAKVDTARIGGSIAFSVTATDPENDKLHYYWTVNGKSVGSDTSVYTRTFTDKGRETVACEVQDGCAHNLVYWDFPVDFPLSVERADSRNPDFSLDPVYPNPVLSSAAGNIAFTISFRLPEGEHSVELALYDAGGRKIALLAEGRFDGGKHAISFQPSAIGREGNSLLEPGVYYVRMSAGGIIRTRAIVILQ